MKAVTEKHNTLNVQIDKILNDANSELNILNQKLNGTVGVRLDSSLLNVNRHADRSGQTEGREQEPCDSIPRKEPQTSADTRTVRSLETQGDVSSYTVCSV